MIAEACERIYGLVKKTPVVEAKDSDWVPSTSKLFLKLDHLQKTGSFKLRGATNKVLSLSDSIAAKGVVTSSTGNHGLAVAAAAKFRKIEAEVFVSEQVSPVKLEWIQAQGAKIKKIGKEPLEAEVAARRAAVESGRTYVSPYNDPFVVAGQGTIGAELYEQLSKIDAVYVAAGGGGLISGIGSYLRSLSPTTEIVGCWPENSRVLYESLQAGKIIEFPETYTVSESTAGGVEEGSITFELAQKVVHRGVLVSEQEILDAMRWAHARGWEIEGAAGVALAAYFKESTRQEGKNAVVLFCGANLSPKVRKHLQ